MQFWLRNLGFVVESGACGSRVLELTNFASPKDGKGFIGQRRGGGVGEGNCWTKSMHWRFPHQRPAVSEALMETIYLNPAQV